MILAHPATRSLVISAPDPFALRDLIPDSRSLAHPDYNVTVKHTLEITKVLRNIGMSAPAPIRYDYPWPGKFRPYAHQIESAEFLTLHKRAFVLSEMGCVDATTEYLSPTGWQRIDAYTGGPVAQYHPDTGTAEFVEPTEYVKLPCAKMVRIQADGLDQLLSMEHRVLLYEGDTHFVTSAEKLLSSSYPLAAYPVGVDGKGRIPEPFAEYTVEPSPDGFKYCFMVPSTFLVLRRNGCVFCTGNTGKTSSTLWAADWLMQHGHVHKALILAPLSTLDRVWKNEIFDTLMHRVASVVHGTQDQRLAALDSDADFYILNHDGVTIKNVMAAIHRRPDIDLVIVDEASMFRNHDTKKYKALTKMLREDQRLWLLTGTPCPNAPTDAWALARLINSKVPPYLGTFRRQTMMQLTQFKWVPRPEAYEIAYAAMQPAVRFRKKDCIDLPPVVTEERSCDMTTEQRKLFDAMRKEMQAEAKGMQINAVNAADKINKLRQILCGAVKDPVTGAYIHIPHEKRLTTLLECIEQASAKVLVVVPFKGIIYELEKEVGKHYTVGVLNGDVSLNKRNEIIAAFKHSPDPHVLLCHPKVMSHGLNLTEADTLVFYAPIYSNDESQQVVERFNRPGQKNKMTVIRLGAHKLEWDIYRMVEGKRVTQESILSLYKSITE